MNAAQVFIPAIRMTLQDPPESSNDRDVPHEHTRMKERKPKNI